MLAMDGSMYPCGIYFHDMILAARVRLIDQEYGNVMKALKVCIHVAYSLK